MKRFLILLCLLLCTGCTALPAEERAFAVALGVDHSQDGWQVYARIPTYKSGGGYTTLEGDGDTLTAALASLESASPMHLHLDQLRLLVFSERMARTDALPAALAVFTDRHDLRMQTAAAVTSAEMKSLFEAMEPAAGARLSKSIDVLLETRSQQGTIPDVTLADILRMGERQSPVLIAVQQDGKEVVLSGGWPVGQDGLAADAPITPEEMRLLSLMQGRLRQGTLVLEDGTARVTDASAECTLLEPTLSTARLRLTLRCPSASLTPEALRQSIATACLQVLTRLAADNCDALGLGRHAMRHMQTMADWHALDWPTRFPQIEWTVSVGVTEAVGRD